MALKVWLVVGDSNTSVSVKRWARLPGPGHQNISNAAQRDRNHVRSTGEVGVREGKVDTGWERVETSNGLRGEHAEKR